MVVFSHIIYYKYDSRECMTWNHPKAIWTTHFYDVTVPAHNGSCGSYGSHAETMSYDTEKDQMRKSVVACVVPVDLCVRTTVDLCARQYRGTFVRF